MESPPDQDKTGSALNAQRFQMLEDIAQELSGEVVFPTYFDAAIRLRKVMQDPNQSLEGIANALAIEPLISTKLLNLANSVLYNPSGSQVRSLQNAIARLGLETTRSTALAIAMNQLLRAKDMANFSDLTRNLWEHSLRTASAAYVIARRLTRFKPDEALLAGLVHDLGAFYMLYRATQYEELRARPDTVRYLIIQWHESIGHTLLIALGLPEDLAEAVREHDQPRLSPPAVPRNLTDIVYIANLMAGGAHEWVHQDAEKGIIERQTLDPAYLALQDEIDERAKEMLTTFA
jgi:HD-like signal output (HDOD) protein